MDLRRVGIQGGDGVGDEGQRPVLHAHEGRGAAGGVEVICRDGCHLVAGEADAGVQHGHIRSETGVGNVGVGNYGADAGQGHRVGGVHG